MPSCCFVPGCKTGLRKYGPSGLSVFRARPDMLEKWGRKIPRKDRVLSKKDGVCEIHFESHLIEREFRYIINGEEVKMSKRPTLKKEAIPTIFPSCPKYLTTVYKKPRKPPKDRTQPKKTERTYGVTKPATKTASSEVDTNPVPPSTSCQEIAITVPSNQTEINGADPKNQSVCESLKNLPLPHGWGRYIDDETVQLFYLDPKSLSYPAALRVECKKEDTFPKIFVRGKEAAAAKPNCGTTVKGLQYLLSKLESTKMCPGFSITELKCGYRCSQSSGFTVHGQDIFSKACTGFHPTLCSKCKYVKDLLTRQDAQMLSKKEMNSELALKKMVRRYVIKVAQLKSRIRETEKEERITKALVLEEALLNLPAIQQEAVRHCFRSSEKKGIKYTKEWLRECSAMRDRSPSLYRHIRKQNILVVPAERTLRNHDEAAKLRKTQREPVETEEQDDRPCAIITVNETSQNQNTEVQTYQIVGCLDIVEYVAMEPQSELSP